MSGIKMFGRDLVEATTEAIGHVWRKIQLFSIGILHFLFSSDKRWSKAIKPTSAAANKKLDAVVPSHTYNDIIEFCRTRKKRIIFVRHAESEWNVVFNRGIWWLTIIRFVRAIVREWLMLPTSDSILIDSPLSRYGVRQARCLYEKICQQSSPLENQSSRSTHLLRYLGCPLPNSIIVCSNLRRAIDTAMIASASRLELPGEKIHVLSCLQELGRNIDTLAINDAYAISTQALTTALQREKQQDELFNLTESHGNKAIRGCGRHRLISFAKWCLCQQQDVIIVYGHSHWFQSFCQELFPFEVEHKSKTEKLENCAVVTFELEEQQPNGYVISPDSFEYL